MTDIVNPAAPAAVSPLAGKPAPREVLVDLAKLERDYYERRPDPGDPNQLVRFGTSGHRGTSLTGTFTEAHVLAITQAICDYRGAHGTDGPLYLGKDTHALSGPAQTSALEVLAANGVDAIIQRDNGVTPTPVISRAILVYNRGRADHFADGIVITPSHNPPEDGGFKYNPLEGGPAGTDVTRWIEDRANALLADGNDGVKRVSSAWRCRPRPRIRKISCCLTSAIWRTSWTWRRFDPAASRWAWIRSVARRSRTGSRSTTSTA